MNSQLSIPPTRLAGAQQRRKRNQGGSTQISLSLTTHRCAAVDCCTAINKRLLLMCQRHWRMVPKSLQQAVGKHYRGVLRGEPGAGKRYRAAVEAAKDAVLTAVLNPDLSLRKREDWQPRI